MELCASRGFHVANQARQICRQSFRCGSFGVEHLDERPPGLRQKVAAAREAFYLRCRDSHDIIMGNGNVSETAPGIVPRR